MVLAIVQANAGIEPDRTPVLLVEDDASLAEIVGLGLERAGCLTTVVRDGISAIEEAHKDDFELLLLDLLLPGVDGLTVCRAVRETSDVPIIIMTAKGQTREVVEGLDAGADDYLVKPFEVDELLARVRAVLRRRTRTPGGLIQAADLEIDLEAATVKKAGSAVRLTATEYRMLLTFVRTPGRVFSREELLREVWGFDHLGDSAMVNMAVKRLRDKVESDPSEPELIATVRGLGYRFDA